MRCFKWVNQAVADCLKKKKLLLEQLSTRQMVSGFARFWCVQRTCKLTENICPCTEEQPCAISSFRTQTGAICLKLTIWRAVTLGKHSCDVVAIWILVQSRTWRKQFLLFKINCPSSPRCSEVKCCDLINWKWLISKSLQYIKLIYWQQLS